MDFKNARHNMVHQQIRTWDVRDPTILSCLDILPRERFVLEPYQSVAYSDSALPIGYDQETLPPKIIARMLQALNISKNDTVLEIGTGTGYVTGLLAKLAKRVVTYEIIPELSSKAKYLLNELNINNIQFEIGDGLQGFGSNVQFDVIILTGSISYLPTILLEQVARNGRLLAVIGENPIMSAILLKQGKERWVRQVLFETLIPPLVNLQNREEFRF